MLTACSAARREQLHALTGALRGQPKLAPTAAEVAAKPYFQMQVDAGSGQAVMVLGSVEDGRLGWYDSAGGAVFTQNGQIVRTLGLPANLDDGRWLGTNPFAAGLQHLQVPVTGVRVVDWSPGYRYGVRQDVRLAPAGNEDLTILGAVHHLKRIDEHVSAPAAGFSAVNHYWVDSVDGLVWKSHQIVAPGVALDTLLLRPYREARP